MILADSVGVVLAGCAREVVNDQIPSWNWLALLLI